ncbi:3',5'-cyclic AMP phosphodiesterase CpdA [Novosphingobium kunmingense]|uniref:3',5'-cyclic AMP phosphodiesterase CpdA n=1 Tax=Novosphingobium kunmingense TaxID=1211806 RepID=A0A2N0H4Y3_9SPHN|nr:metallophosphoesterase [Novosphingobium kunmingense]PKB13985.1 3',5'-cyclic AMP phosphodiesterase CpdA [Novosphingobium kunmingense]
MTRQRLTLFHVSDLHFGLEDKRALSFFKAELAREKPAAVLITGDLTMRARHREFRAACEWVSALDVPVTVEVGNHDMPYFNLIERFTDPYRRFRSIEKVLEKELLLPGLAVIPLKTATRAQWRFPWSNGWVTDKALGACCAALDALPPGTRAIVTAHHPLTERDPRGKKLTIGGNRAMEELARRGVFAILTGHVHDAFDIDQPTPAGPLRMIGAGTLSQRIRSTPPSFNVLYVEGDTITVDVRNFKDVPTAAMQIDAVPENALPPRHAGDPVAPVGEVPAVDPPVH